MTIFLLCLTTAIGIAYWAITRPLIIQVPTTTLTIDNFQRFKTGDEITLVRTGEVLIVVGHHNEPGNHGPITVAGGGFATSALADDELIIL